MKTIIYLLSISIFIVACEPSDSNIDGSFGRLKGTIGKFEGNCMPVIVCEPAPLSTTIAITIPSEYFSTEALIDSIISDSEGNYEILLPPGNYSLFLRDTSGFVCDTWSCNSDCYCTYFKVKADSITIVNANIDHAVW
jgi:hypothetical protein